MGLSLSEMAHTLSVACVSPKAVSPSETDRVLSMECVSLSKKKFMAWNDDL